MKNSQTNTAKQNNIPIESNNLKAKDDKLLKPEEKTLDKSKSDENEKSKTSKRNRSIRFSNPESDQDSPIKNLKENVVVVNNNNYLLKNPSSTIGSPIEIPTPIQKKDYFTNTSNNNVTSSEQFSLKTDEILPSDTHKQAQAQEININNIEKTNFEETKFSNFMKTNTLKDNDLLNKRMSIIKKMSDNTLNFNNELQALCRDSRLNLSISRISLKNNFQDTATSKLRAAYKKQNDSILNITNLKANDNQILKFFSNNSLYEKKKMTVIDQNKTQLMEKVVSTAQTSKKLASDVISIYRENVKSQLIMSPDKIEAKEVIKKQINSYRPIAEGIVKREIIPETDVEKIMRMPIHKFANTLFIGSLANMTFLNNTNQKDPKKITVAAIDPNSRVLSPIKNVKEKVKEEIFNETNYTFKPEVHKKNTISSRVSSQNNTGILINRNDAKNGIHGLKNSDKILEREKIIESQSSFGQKKQRRLEEGLVINKFKEVVDGAIWN